MTAPRGFAAMDPARHREIASLGGKAAHAQGTGHEWTGDEAAAAGRKGGLAVAQDRTHMARIGAIGGSSRGKRSGAQTQTDLGQPQTAAEPLPSA